MVRDAAAWRTGWRGVAFAAATDPRSGPRPGRHPGLAGGQPLVEPRGLGVQAVEEHAQFLLGLAPFGAQAVDLQDLQEAEHRLEYVVVVDAQVVHLTDRHLGGRALEAGDAVA